jgi:hypothetical protein
MESDLGNREVGVAEQRGRPLDAPGQEIAMRRDAEGLPERSRKVRFRHAAHSREAPHRPLLVRCRIHPVFRAQQTAQELGVLNRTTCRHAGHCTQRAELRLCQSIGPSVARELAISRGVVLPLPRERYTQSTSRKKSKKHARRDS